MSVIKVRSSTKWMKDNYSMYTKPAKKKKRKTNNQKKTKVKDPLSKGQFYEQLRKRGEMIQPQSKPYIMAKRILNQSKNAYLPLETVEVIFEAYQLTKQNYISTKDVQFVEDLKSNLEDKFVNSSIIKLLIGNRTNKPIKESKKTNSVSEKKRRSLNKLALQPKYKR